MAMSASSVTIEEWHEEGTRR